MTFDIWMTLDEWPNYDVSNLGNVRRNCHGKGKAEAGRMLKPDTNRDGYEQVRLQNATKSSNVTVHRLVCTAFHGPCPEKHQVAHLDNVRNNNYASNLKWVTSKENCSHRVAAGTNPAGGRNGSAILTEEEALHILKTKQTWRPVQAVADHYGVSIQTIYNIRSGEGWRHLTV